MTVTPVNYHTDNLSAYAYSEPYIALPQAALQDSLFLYQTPANLPLDLTLGLDSLYSNSPDLYNFNPTNSLNIPDIGQIPYPDTNSIGYNNLFGIPTNQNYYSNPFFNYQGNKLNFDFSDTQDSEEVIETKTYKKSPSNKRVSLAEIEEAGLKFVSDKHRNRWDNMDPKMQRALKKLVEYGKSKGITIYINSSVRSEAEQRQLIANGAPAAKKGSKHLTGRAVDIRVSGNRSQNLAILGKYWKSMGYRWGADFVRPTSEPWHFDIG